MLCYLDRAFCSDTQCQRDDCDRKLTFEVLEEAGKLNLPVALMDFPDCTSKHKNPKESCCINCNNWDMHPMVYTTGHCKVKGHNTYAGNKCGGYDA